MKKRVETNLRNAQNSFTSAQCRCLVALSGFLEAKAGYHYHFSIIYSIKKKYYRCMI